MQPSSFLVPLHTACIYVLYKPDLKMQPSRWLALACIISIYKIGAKMRPEIECESARQPVKSLSGCARRYYLELSFEGLRNRCVCHHFRI